MDKPSCRPSEYLETLFERDAVESRWLKNVINDWWRIHIYDEFDCVDNARLMRVGVNDEENLYNEAVCDGCCGSHSVEFGPSPAGHTYLYGFNYGH